MEKSDIINCIYELADMDISAFPIGKGYFDKKIGAYTYKKAGVPWSEYREKVPSDDVIEGWESLPEINGIGLITGIVSNIVCIDVDTSDPELERRILELLPNTPCIVMGNPTRAGKFIYKMYDDINNIPIERKSNLKGVDILMGNSYICIPPGTHSSLDNIKHPYSWKYQDIISCWDDIPVMPPLLPDQIQMAVDGCTKQEIINNMPSAGDVVKGTTIERELRNNTMVKLASSLIRNRTPVDHAIQQLIDFDAKNYSDNLFFADKSKGHKHRDMSLNARIFYTSLLDSINRKKTLDEQLELPKQTTVSSVIDGNSLWPEVLELDELIQFPKFDYEMVPVNMRTPIKEISELNAVSPQNVFLYMLGAFSATIGNKVMVKPYLNNKKFLQACNLYVGIVAASGERKTQTTSQAKAPLMLLHKQQQQKYKQDVIESKDHNEAISMRTGQLRKERETAIKNEGPDSEDGKQILLEIEENESRRIILKKKTLYEQENTTEKNYEITSENPNGFFIEYNEWGCAYNKLQNKDFASLRRYILDGWDGDAMLSYKTKHQGEQYIENYCLSVGFSVQLSVIQEQIWQLQQTTDDGLLPRFMLSVSDTEDRPVQDYASSIDTHLLSIFTNSDEIEASDIPIPFTNKASLAWQSYQELIIKELKNQNDVTLRSFRSKHVGLVVRVSALIAIINNNGIAPDSVTISDFNNAVNIMEYTWESTKALFNSSLKKLLEKIILEIKMTSIPSEILVSDLMRNHSHLFSKNSLRVMELLQALHSLNIARFDRSSTRATLIKFNPKLFEQ